MKKYVKSLTYFLLIFTTFCGTLHTNSLTAHARLKEPIYTLTWETNHEKVHIPQNDFRGAYISIQIPSTGYKIINLVSNSKNCTATIANQSVTNKVEMTGEDEISSNTFYSAENWIELYASKKGTYQIKFDIINSSGKIVKSKSLKVYADKEDGVRSVTVNGRLIRNYNRTFCTDAKNIILKVKMNSGYKLVRIVQEEYGRPDKIVKNGKKFQLYTKNEDASIRIYFKDKYTGRIEYRLLYIRQWKD